ncbi:hypothetical protein DXG03_002684 [Asterophora parasitica]|uniref:Uncharacterized protein n=1 Tax=Asterophora parasitica TaxID=117018 RepID=A0A9P7KER0_9AGAR|nr:hypothetical protein DXG03_002684 [Asterophora parasitica]
MDAVDITTLLSPTSNQRKSFPSTSLSSAHIAQALQRSSDNGATLMFSKMNLSDVGALAAEELAALGRETPDDESPVKREADRPPPLHLGILGTFSAENSPTRSVESYLPSPANSDFFDNRTAKLTPVEPHLHGRNASYGGALHPTPHMNLLGKKSMPDLRTAKLNFPKKNTEISELTLHPTSSRGSELASSTALPQREDPGSSLSSNRAAISLAREKAHPSPTLLVSSMAFERNSYFQRLSSLPVSTALPKPLMCLIDSARSILFAMCQVYQTLEHYMVHAIDNRISSVLRKVLDPASADMIHLITSLDRFDAMSRKTLPSSTLCRAVVENCRDTVAVFGKAIGVLALQLKVFVTGDDARYSRWILLELHGATAEVSCAWQAMIPQIEAIKPLLLTKSHVGQPPPVVNNPAVAEPYSASPTSSTSGHLDPAVSLRPQQGPPASGERVRTARRHAGSFSSKDVEIGKKLPSYDDPPPGMLGGIISGVARPTPTLRAPKRKVTIPITTISSPYSTAPMQFALPSSFNVTSFSYLDESSRHINHSRQGSQASLQTSASSSPSVPSKASLLDLPSNSKSQVDREALQAVQAAVEVAPAVWNMISDLFDDTSDAKPSVRDTLEKARVVTARLSETLDAMHDTEVLTDRKDLREDAHAFLKVIRFPPTLTL